MILQHADGDSLFERTGWPVIHNSWDWKTPPLKARSALPVGPAEQQPAGGPLTCQVVAGYVDARQGLKAAPVLRQDACSANVGPLRFQNIRHSEYKHEQMRQPGLDSITLSSKCPLHPLRPSGCRKPTNQSISQSFNQSFNQLINQSNNQCTLSSLKARCAT